MFNLNPSSRVEAAMSSEEKKRQTAKTNCALKDLVMLFAQIPLLIMAVTYHALRGKIIFPVVPTCFNPWDFQSRSKTGLRHYSQSCWLGQPAMQVLLPKLNLGTHVIPQPLSRRIWKCRKVCGFPLSSKGVIPTLVTSELDCTIYPPVCNLEQTKA